MKAQTNIGFQAALLEYSLHAYTNYRGRRLLRAYAKIWKSSPMRENLSLGFLDKVRLKLAGSATETS